MEHFRFTVTLYGEYQCSLRLAGMVKLHLEDGLSDCVAQSLGVAIALHIGCQGGLVRLAKHTVDGGEDRVRGLCLAKVEKHHLTCPDHADRVCDALACNVWG